jgi:hypothetical protein
MKKEDLNACMLFKMRNKGLCVLLLRDFDGIEYQPYEVFYNLDYLAQNCPSGVSALSSYDNSLINSSTYDNDYDIMAIKQLNSTNEVLYYIFNNIEPKSWDWIRKENRTNSIDVMIKANLNQTDINEIKKTIEDLQNKLDNLKINLSV